MKRIALVAIAIGGLVAAAGAARAETPGWYVGIGGGYAGSADPDIGTHPDGNPYFKQDHLQDGWGVLGNVGYSWGTFKLEGELGYRSMDFNAMDFPSGAGFVHTPASGSMTNLDGMVNGYWIILPNSRWSPYLGAGVGVADIGLNSFAVTPAHSKTIQLANGSDAEPAFQGIAGISYYINPAWSLGLEYRYFGIMQDATFTRTGQSSTMKADYGSQNVFVNIAYHFGAPPPPPPVMTPAAAPAPMPAPMARTFLVFFDFDKYNLTPDARRVVQAAAQSYKVNGVAHIDVTGYTDLAGSVAYNLKLSQRRANAVAEYLAQQGVPRNAMAIVGRGKSNPRVPTPDGVREPQNRRVEIVMP
jgi:OmpA-OmpF porin, OOP family